MRDIEIVKRIEELRIFRSLIGVDLSSSDIGRIWGPQYSKNSEMVECNQLNGEAEEKIHLLKRSLSHFLFFDKVKFIGISGSVGAGFAKKEDDIDLFIVVEDDFMWIYRLFLELSNLFGGRIRLKKDKNDVKDKFCVNLIAEERGIVFDNDIFNFHELMFLKPVYNEKYMRHILFANEWVFDDWGVRSYPKSVEYVRTTNPVKKVLNEICFLMQLSFMYISNHSPDYARLKKNNSIGRIEFFPQEFKSKKMKNYMRRLKSNQSV
ncbi:MAG TPA: hypothetical protein PLD77_01125 [Candidatus Dojkabacteria bacterium]|nr:hypothetical protein [Candidatus Dojkabacteria bacterium]